MRFASRFAALLLVFTLPGCAGGWRSGSPPAGYEPYSGNSTGAAAAPGAVATAPAAKVSAATAGKSTEVGAGEVTFRFGGTATSVAVAGEFNAWSTSADPMARRTDGVWELKKALSAGRYQYKFVVNGGEWKPDDSATETQDDGFGGKNSVVVVGTPTAATTAAPATTPKGTGPAVTAGGVVFRYTGPGNTVNLAGEFNSWSTSADAMTKGADGAWTLTKSLPAGRHAYKFVIDGGTWKEDPNAAEFVDDGYGGKNAIVVVGAGAAASPTAAPAATPAEPMKVTGKAKPPVVAADGVTFTFAGTARSVALAGDFNDWSLGADPMKQQGDGTWTITKRLPPGTHAYKFVVDGSAWKTDDANPATTDDGFGGKNSVVVVK